MSRVVDTKEKSALFPFDIKHYWTRDNDWDEGVYKKFEIDGNPVKGSVPPQEETFSYDGVTVTLTRSQRYNSHHYMEGYEDIRATDVVIKIEKLNDALWPIKTTHEFKWCARLE